ncbi:RNA-directed DNA polymerase, eukaryota [Tanacetum coccineum]
MVDGNWIKSPKAVKGEFFQHFSSGFDKPNASRATINMRYPKTLTYDQQNELESEVSNVEIKRAVWDCGTDKSPGLDGFTFGFYRRFWKIIENDVYDAVKYFFTYGNIPKGCNSSFIALIPKIPDANMVKDFRPISLIGSLYKIIAKILANRLVGVLGDIVNELRINMSKSKILGVNVDSDKVKGVASKLGCLILKTPFTYLGSKVGGSMSRVHAWNEVIDRVKNRLSKWKMKTLSIGGKLTLPRCKNLSINLLDCMHVKLGNGDKTVFWEDIWIDGKTLKNRVPRIYSLESCKLITDQFNELSALVHDVSLIPMSDRWKWDLESSGEFSVASVRKMIDDKSLPEVDSKTRWIKYVPIKVNVHAWKVKTDSLPTRFNVSRRGIDIDSIMCVICDNGGEDI